MCKLVLSTLCFPEMYNHYAIHPTYNCETLFMLGDDKRNLLGQQIKYTCNSVVLNEGSPFNKNIPQKSCLSAVRT